MKNKNLALLLLRISVVLLIVGSIGLLTTYIFKYNMVPIKYLIALYVTLFLIVPVSIFFIFKCKKKPVRIGLSIFLIMISIGGFIGTNYLKNTYKFLEGTQVEYDYLNYSVLVKSDSDYSKINNLKNKKIMYLDDKYTEEVRKEIEDKVAYEEVIAETSPKMYESLDNGEVDAIILEEGYLMLSKEEIEDFEKNTKAIYTFKIKVKAHKEKSKDEKEVSVTSEPFILYISGIDQYGNVNSVRGRSDVNQIMVINPKSNHILIANTPRDYYVQLSGTTGLRDKLTHAGIYGIEKSISTLEEIYDIDINHYIRINFDSLIKLVDIIGGVDIDSDKEFTCWTNKKVHVKKGINHFNGTQALAYARERKSYVDGDHHRGRNQQQVIEAIISKLTSDDILMKKYNSILNSLDGTFQTDMDVSLITSFIKYQLDKNPKWNVETTQVNGFSSWGYTYSMGYKYYLWVMEPDWKSVNSVKNRIKEVLGEQEVVLDGTNNEKTK